MRLQFFGIRQFEKKRPRPIFKLHQGIVTVTALTLFAVITSQSELPASGQSANTAPKFEGEMICGTKSGPEFEAVWDAHAISYYIETLDKRVKAVWAPPKGLYRTTVISLEVGRNGEMSNLHVVKTSGSAPFDDAALSAVKSTTPFPPLPQPRQKPKITAQLTFTNSALVEQRRERIAYLTKVQDAVLKRWRPPGGSEKQASTGFRIEKSGAMAKLHIDSTSGDIAFNKATMDAIRYAAPFPPLPSAFAKANIDVTLTFGKSHLARIELPRPGREREVLQIERSGK